MSDATKPRTSSQPANQPDEYRSEITFDPQTESVTEILSTTISLLDGRELQELPPLNEFIDPEALDGLFSPRADGTLRHPGCTIFFTYADYEVRIESDGTIALTESAIEPSE